MVDVASSLGLAVIATFVPLLVGLLLPRTLLRPMGSQFTIWVVGAAAGIMLWFFFDVMGAAAQLGVNQGFGGDFTQVILATMFAVGVTFLFGLDKRLSTKLSAVIPSHQIGPLETGITLTSAAVVALGIGFHAIGEGVYIADAVSYSSTTGIIFVIGGLWPGVAYVLHKAMEGFVIGVFGVLASALSLRRVGIFVLLSGLPMIVGFFIGYLSLVTTSLLVLDSTYFFALGGAVTVYVEMRLLPILSRGGLYASVPAFLLGFYAMYLAALFHSQR